MKDFIKASERIKTPFFYRINRWLFSFTAGINMINRYGNKNIQIIIKNAVCENRHSYYNLLDLEKRILIKELLINDEQTPLSDADHGRTLQHLIAQSIVLDDESTFQNFRKEIDKLFVTGDKHYAPHYIDIIEELLNDEWAEQNARPNEHFEHDFLNRNRELALENSKSNNKYS